MPQDELPPLGKFVVQSYVEDDLAYPVVVVARDNRANGYVVPTALSTCPDPKFPTHQFLGVTPTSVDRRVLWIYEKLPGPLITSTRLDDDGALVTVTRQRTALGSIVTNETLVGTVWTRKFKGEGNSDVALQITETRAVPGNLIEDDEEWDDANKVFVSTFSKLVPASDEPEAPSTSAIQAYGFYTNSIASFAITDPGSGYLTAPLTLGIPASPGGGTQAAGTVSSLKLVQAIVDNPGSGLSLGDTVTLSGGTSTTAATATVASVSLASLTLSSAGTTVEPGTTALLLGGVYSTPGAVQVTTTKVTGSAVLTAGTGYESGMVITTTGGTSTTAATLTVASVKVVSLALNAAGSAHRPGDVLTMVGGTPASAATVTVSTVALDTLLIGYGGTSYVPGDVLTLVGGAFSVAAQVTVATVGISNINITINTPGTGYTVGDVVTLTDGTPSVAATAEVTAVDGGGGVTSVNLVTGGSYTVAPSTSAVTGGTGTGLVINIPAFALTINSFTISTAGNYSALPTTFTATGGTGLDASFQGTTAGGDVLTFALTSGGAYTGTNPTSFTSTSSGSGSGATFNTLVFGVNAVTVTNAGSYTVNATTLTQSGATSPSGGTGFTGTPSYGANAWTLTAAGSYTTAPSTLTTSGGTTFTSATYTPLTLSVANAGAYTAVPSSPVAVTGGSGLTAVCSFGLGTTSLSNGGTGYTSNYVPITVAGNGLVQAVMGAASKTLATGYLVFSAMKKVPGSTLVRRYVFKIMPLPPAQMNEQPDIPFEWPAIFTILTQQSNETPSPGFDFDLLQHRRGRYTGFKIDYFQIGQFNDLPPRFSMQSPAAASKLFPIPNNCVHNAFTWFKQSGGVIVYGEAFAASTPYYIGQLIVVSASQKRLAGEIWQKTVVYLREY